MAVIPPSLQPPIRPQTQAELQALKQIQPISVQPQQVVIPSGAIGKKQIETQLTQVQNALSQLSLDRAIAYKQATTGGRSLGQSQLESFNIKWNLMREQLRATRKSLSSVKGMIGDNYVSQEALNQFISGNVGAVAQQLESSQRAMVRSAEERKLYGADFWKLSDRKKAERVQAVETGQYDPITQTQAFSLTEQYYKSPEGQLAQWYERQGIPQAEAQRKADIEIKQSRGIIQKEITTSTEELGLVPPRDQTFGERFVQSFIYEDPILGGLARGIQRVTGREIIESGEKVFWKPETEAERIRRESSEAGFQQLPFGLQPYRAGDDKFQITKTLLSPYELVTGKEVPEWAGETLDFYVKTLLFGQFLKTGTTARAEAQTEQGQRKALEKYIKYLKKKQKVKNIKGKKVVRFLTKEELFKQRMIDINKHMAQVLKETDPVKREAMLRGTKELFSHAYGNRESTRLLTEWASQQGYMPSQSIKFGESRFSGMGLGKGRLGDSGLGQGRISDLGGMGSRFGVDLTPELTIDITKIGGFPQMTRVPEVSTFTKLLTGFVSEEIPQEKIRQDSLIQPFTLFDFKTKQDLTTRQAQDFEQPQKNMVSLISPQMQTPSLKQPQKTKQDLTTDIIQGVFNMPPQIPRVPRVPTKKKPPKKIPKIIPFWFAGEKEFIKKERVGYHGYAMKGATTRGKKWVRVTDKPHTFEGAKSKVFRVVDETISARGKVQAIKQTKTIKGKKKTSPKLFKKLQRGDDYSGFNMYKFREYKKVKGRKILTPHQYIEKKKFRLDSSGEKRKIQYERKRQAPLNFGIGGIRGQPKTSKSKKKRRQPFRL